MRPSQPDENLKREAMAELDRLLDSTPAERTNRLEELARTRPGLRTLVVELLAHAEVAQRGFMEPAALPAIEGALREGSRLGPYRIIRLLGEGGMGEVWLASRDDGLYDGQVAIKTLNPYFAGGALRERFLREANVLGRLAHPNIARLLDAGIHDGVVYLVLECVIGQSIDVACDEARFDIPTRLEIFRKLCAAVAHAHSSLVVHRDIKPGNVLLTADGMPKLLDFGIASFFEAETGGTPSDITRLSGRVFTPQYAAPEQVLGEEITTATDVYSLGVLLYLLLTGKLAYEVGEGPRTQWEHAVLHTEPRRMIRALESGDHDAIAAARSTTYSRLHRELGGDLENIVQKALKKRPQDRYPTVAAFADDLRRYSSGEPVLARPDSFSYRLGKVVRRNWLAVGAAAAIVVALGVGLAVSLWQLQVARAERRHAEETKEFVASIFRSADPFFTGKPDMSAVGLLELAHERIESELASKPATAAELLNIVGESQNNLEQYEAAKITLTKALEIAERLQPRDEYLVAIAQTGLATAAINLDERDAVRPLYEKALPVLRATMPRSARKYGDALQMLAYFDSDERKLDDAIRNSREAVVVLDTAFGRVNSETILARRNLALYLVLARQHEEAKPLLEQVLQDERAMPPSSQRTALLAMTESSYGRLLVDTADIEGGIVHLESGIEHATQAFGEKSQSVSAQRSLLARAYSRLGNVPAMLENSRRAYEATENGRGKARMLTTFGRYTLLARKVPESLEPLRAAIELEKRDDTGKGSWLPLAQADYGVALGLSGRLAEAERSVADSLPAAKASAAEGTLAAYWNARGRLQQLRSEWAASEVSFRTALENTSPADLSPKFRTDALLGLGLTQLELGKAAEAEQLLRQADEAARASYVNLTPLRAEIDMNMGRALLERKNVATAVVALTVAHQYWQGYDTANRLAGETAYWLAQARIAAGENAAARALLAQAAPVLEKSPLSADLNLAQAARLALTRLPK